MLGYLFTSLVAMDPNRRRCVSSRKDPPDIPNCIEMWIWLRAPALAGKTGLTDTELTVALVGVGGAVIGGAAAIYSASSQGKRTAEGAAKTYEGVLDAARRAHDRRLTRCC
ncbi:hypothetical protein [Streptomyces atroolivaceus]|uniref:hypothetical protein n=1 Tax=Streptomyces atroolivaceus TaxID=66869 RepID=UPI0037A1FF15